MSAPFLQLNAWVNIWCGLLHILVAAGGYTKLVRMVTAFSGEIFGFFISVAYIYLGLKNIVVLFPSNLNSDSVDDPVSIDLASAFASVVLAALMYGIAMAFHHAKQWRTLNDAGRWALQSYGLVLTLVACTALSYAPIFYNDNIDVQRLPVPDGEDSWSGSGPIPSDSAGRLGWTVVLMGSDENGNKMEVWMVFVAIFPAIMLLIL